MQLNSHLFLLQPKHVSLTLVSFTPRSGASYHSLSCLFPQATLLWAQTPSSTIQKATARAQATSVGEAATKAIFQATSVGEAAAKAFFQATSSREVTTKVQTTNASLQATSSTEAFARAQTTDASLQVTSDI